MKLEHTRAGTEISLTIGLLLQTISVTTGPVRVVKRTLGAVRVVKWTLGAVQMVKRTSGPVRMVKWNSKHETNQRASTWGGGGGVKQSPGPARVVKWTSVPVRDCTSLDVTSK